MPSSPSTPSPWEASLPSTDSQLQRLALLDAHVKALLLIDTEEDGEKQAAVPGAYSPSFPHGKSEEPAVMWAGANRGRVEGLLKRYGRRREERKKEKKEKGEGHAGLMTSLEKKKKKMESLVHPP